MKIRYARPMSSGKHVLTNLHMGGGGGGVESIYTKGNKK